MSQLEDFSSNFISNSWDVHKLKSLRDVFNKRSVEDGVKKYGRVWKSSRSIYLWVSILSWGLQVPSGDSLVDRMMLKLQVIKFLYEDEPYCLNCFHIEVFI